MGSHGMQNALPWCLVWSRARSSWALNTDREWLRAAPVTAGAAPVFIRLAGGSFGFQIGGQGTDLVLVATNYKGFQDLLHDKFKIGADASAAAGPVGRDAQASTDISMRAEMLTWSRSRGLFAGIDLNGATVSQNQEDTDVLYGGPHHFDAILRGDVPPPPQADGFLHAIRHYFGEAEMR